MNPFYLRVSTNFGDHMNSWLWPELIPELLNEEDGIRLIGIGSLLSRNLDLVVGKKVVFGTGSGYSSLPSPEQAANWRIYGVRGPLTARFLGLPPEKAITDGAWLINQIPRYAELSTARKGIVFIPHWTTAAYGNWPEVCRRAGIDYVDPLWDCDRVFSALANAELVLTESLHGAILSDYYRTPWIPVVTPSRILKYKWLDWCQSLDLPYRPYALPPSDFVDFLFQRLPRTPAPTAPQLIDVPDDTFDVPRSAPPPKSAGPAYRMKIRVKTVLREGRQVVLGVVQKLRNSILFRSWNDRYMDGLAQYLQAIARETPTLSTDEIRADRIARLNAALDQMRRDYLAERG